MIHRYVLTDVNFHKLARAVGCASKFAANASSSSVPPRVHIRGGGAASEGLHISEFNTAIEEADLKV